MSKIKPEDDKVPKKIDQDRAWWLRSNENLVIGRYYYETTNEINGREPEILDPKRRKEESQSELKSSKAEVEDDLKATEPYFAYRYLDGDRYEIFSQDGLYQWQSDGRMYYAQNTVDALNNPQRRVVVDISTFGQGSDQNTYYDIDNLTDSGGYDDTLGRYDTLETATSIALVINERYEQRRGRKLSDGDT